MCASDGVERLLTHLDRSYGVDANNQRNANLAAFLNYSWHSDLTVDQFIAGFNARSDRIACLQFNETVKGHLLLRLSGRTPSDQNIIVAASAGNYEVQNLIVSLRNAYRQVATADTMTQGMQTGQNPTHYTGSQPRNVPYHVEERAEHNPVYQESRQIASYNREQPVQPTTAQGSCSPARHHTLITRTAHMPQNQSQATA